ncbi:MAG: hypothetical protein WA323_07480 [Candidatus Nitrosopolaris sp.]|jgi:hypothetical protein
MDIANSFADFQQTNLLKHVNTSIEIEITAITVIGTRATTAEAVLLVAQAAGVMVD